jgi:hypothetical protein
VATDVSGGGVVNSTPYPHLHAASRGFADEEAEIRIRRIHTDRWITYPKAEEVLGRLEQLFTFPKRTRMPNLLLIGPTNNGKTMIVEKFKRVHPVIEARATADGIARIPVVKIQMHASPDERRFFGSVLQELGDPFKYTNNLQRLEERMLQSMRTFDVKLLILDEVHNLLSGTRAQQRRFLNLLRWLGNELRIPLVAVGTTEALYALQSDDQLANRFEPLRLPLWTDDKEYRQLLSTLEAVLPLREPSYLATSPLATEILSAGEGILGEIVTLITRAAVRSVLTGTESISARMIQESGFISPSQRRRAAL